MRTLTIAKYYTLKIPAKERS